MRGFQKDTGSNVLYLGIKHNGICEESKKEREGFEQIKVPLRNGEEIIKYIRRYRTIKAYVDNINYKDTGDQFEFRYQSWLLSLTDEDGDKAILEISLNSSSGVRFMKLAENIDWKQLVEFSAWHDTVKDKTAFNVKQGGQTVPQKYKQPTDENPDAMGDCPQAVQRGRTGKWDYTAQEDFLFDRMQTVVMPAVDAAAAARAMQQPEKQTGSNAPPDDDWNDDDPAF